MKIGKGKYNRRAKVPIPTQAKSNIKTFGGGNMSFLRKLMVVAFAIAALMVSGYMTLVQAQDDRINVLTQNISRSNDFYATFFDHDEYLIQLFPSALFEYSSHIMVQSPMISDSTITGKSVYASAIKLMGQEKNRNDTTRGNYKIGYGVYFGNRTGLSDRNGYSPLQALFAKNYGAIRFGIIAGLQYSKKADVSTAYNLSDFGLALRPSLTGLFGNGLGFDASIPFHVRAAAFKRPNLDDSTQTDVGFGFTGRFRSRFLNIPVQIMQKSVSEKWNIVGDSIDQKTADTLQIDMGCGKNIDYAVMGVRNLITCQVSGALMSCSYSTVQSRPGRTDFTTSSSSTSIVLFTLVGDEMAIGKYFKLRIGQSFIIGDYTMAGPENSFAFGTNGLFTSGFGFHWRSLSIDASLGTDLFNNGPYLLTGKASGFAPSFNARFDF